jgi:gluconokinase
MIIVIFGVSGAGKTTVGKMLAEQLGWRFLEADDFIRQQTSKRCAVIIH